MITLIRRLTILVAAFAGLIACQSASAQYAYVLASYTGGSIVGSAFYQHDYSCCCTGTDLQIHVFVDKPSGQQSDVGTAEGSDCELEFDFSYNNADQYGSWSVQADNSYFTGSPAFWESEEWSSADVFVNIEPYWESSAYNSDVSGGAFFFVTLGPYKYVGGWVDQVVNTISDTCYSQLPSGPQFTFSPGGTSVDINNKYGETIVDGAGSAWVDYYNAAIAAHSISPCGWSANQTMTFNGDPYYNAIVIGQSLSGTSTTTNRDGATHTASWN